MSQLTYEQWCAMAKQCHAVSTELAEVEAKLTDVKAQMVVNAHTGRSDTPDLTQKHKLLFLHYVSLYTKQEALQCNTPLSQVIP